MKTITIFILSLALLIIMSNYASAAYVLNDPFETGGTGYDSANGWSVHNSPGVSLSTSVKYQGSSSVCSVVAGTATFIYTTVNQTSNITCAAYIYVNVSTGSSMSGIWSGSLANGLQWIGAREYPNYYCGYYSSGLDSGISIPTATWVRVAVYTKNFTSFYYWVNNTYVGNDAHNNVDYGLQIGYGSGAFNAGNTVCMDNLLCWQGNYTQEPLPLLNLSNFNCTSSGTTMSPYITSDTTPTFNFTSNITANCRISNKNLAYQSMNSSRDCTGGEGTLSHVCTLTAQDELTTPAAYVYAACIATGNPGNNASVTLLMTITNLFENSTAAIEQGIRDSVIGTGATIYTNQQVYLRSLNNSQFVGTVEKLAAYGNQRWLFHYYNDTGNPLGLFNITPVVYTLEIYNRSLTDIDAVVSGFINSTKN